MAEHLALAEQVNWSTVIEELDGSATNDADPALWLHALGQDLGSSGKELDLHPAGKPLERLFIEPAERVPGSQELGDVVHPSLGAVYVSPRSRPRPPRR